MLAAIVDSMFLLSYCCWGSASAFGRNRFYGFILCLVCLPIINAILADVRTKTYLNINLPADIANNKTIGGSGSLEEITDIGALKRGYISVTPLGLVSPPDDHQ